MVSQYGKIKITVYFTQICSQSFNMSPKECLKKQHEDGDIQLVYSQKLTITKSGKK